MYVRSWLPLSLCATAALAQPTVYVTLDVQTDAQNHVLPGSTVNWTVSVSGDDDHEGLAFLLFDMANSEENPVQINLRGGAPTATTEVFDRPLGLSNLHDDGTSAFGGSLHDLNAATRLLEIGGAQNTLKTVGDPGFFQNTEPLLDFGSSATDEVFVAGSFTAPGRQGVYTLCLERGVANVINLPAGSNTIAVHPAEVVFDPPCVTFEVRCPGDENADGVIDMLDALIVINRRYGTLDSAVLINDVLTIIRARCLRPAPTPGPAPSPTPIGPTPIGP
ncbi:MAG: hypothetical protein CMJ31_03085 [Phycisphaerae bacterium]|nr:hypothetical protein [Phycisphaerae bacterium]